MKLFPALTTIAVLIALSSQASAANKKKHRHHRHPAASQIQAAPPAPERDIPDSTLAPAEQAQSEGQDGQKDIPLDVKTAKPAKPVKPVKSASPSGNPPKASMDFDFFPDSAGGGAGSDSAGLKLSPEALELQHEGQTRRWMLTTHQTLGIATWILMAATVTVGQLNYNQLYGGGGSNKWQTPHEILVLSSSLAFAATGAFALFAPSPYKKPLRFDTGLVHRIAVSGATLGMLTEIFLGWWTTHQGNAGNPNNLRTMARTHQVVGWTTFGFLTAAAAVWVF
jgi:hypothetical protein